MGDFILAPQAVSRVPALSFSVSDKETLCALNLTAHEESLRWQESVARELHTVFKNGALIDDEMIGVDKWKAKKYASMAQLTSQNDTVWRTESVYALSRWVNDVRLLLLRTNRFLTLIGQAVLGSLGFVLSAIGCSYLLRFLFDLGVVLKHGFVPENQHEVDAGFIKRCQMALHRDGRAFRMRNDLVWFLVNTTTFIISIFTLGVPKLVGSLLNIFGFGFDTINESNEYKVIQKQKKLSHKITEHLVHLQVEMQNLVLKRAETKKAINALIAKLPNKNIKNTNNGFYDLQERLVALKLDMSRLDKRYDKCVSAHERYTYIQGQLKKKISQDTKMRGYIIVATSVLFLTMTAFFLWPAYLTGIAVVAGVALVSGSIANGLGRRVYQTVKGYFSRCQAAPSAVSPGIPPEGCEAVLERAPLVASRSSHAFIQETIRATNQEQPAVPVPSVSPTFGSILSSKQKTNLQRKAGALSAPAPSSLRRA